LLLVFNQDLKDFGAPLAQRKISIIIAY